MRRWRMIAAQREQQRQEQHGVHAKRNRARRDTLSRFWMLQRHNEVQRMLASAAPDALVLRAAILRAHDRFVGRRSESCSATTAWMTLPSL